MSIYAYPTENFGANPSTGVQPNAQQAMTIGQNMLNTNQGLANMYNQQNMDMSNQIAAQNKNSMQGLQLDQANTLYPGQIQNMLGQQQAENMALVGHMAGQVSGLLKGLPAEQRPAAYQQLLSTSPELAKNPMVQQIGQLPGDLMTNALDQVSNSIAMADPAASQKAQIQAQEIAGQGANALRLANVQGGFGLQGRQIGANAQLGVAGIQSQTSKDVAGIQASTSMMNEQTRAQAQKDVMSMQITAERFHMTPEQAFAQIAHEQNWSADRLLAAINSMRTAAVVPHQVINPNTGRLDLVGPGGKMYGNQTPGSNQNLPLVTGEGDYNKLQSGQQYIYNGQVYTKK